MAEDILLNAPSAGTPKRDTAIAVMQSTAGTKIQQMPLSTLAFDTTAKGSTVDTQFLTPKGFAASTADESTSGIMRASSSADITSESNNVAVTCDKQEDLFFHNTSTEKTFSISDLDSVNTQAVGTDDVTVANMVSMKIGNMRVLNGSITLDPTDDKANLELVFNDARQPSFTQVGSIAYGSAATGTQQLSGSASIEVKGVEVDGIGQIKIVLGNEDEGLNWDNATTYTIAFSFIYKAKF
jgi:hypothetical protein